MKTPTKKALMVASVVPTALVLAACRGDMGIQLNEDGSVVITMTMEDTSGQLTGLMTCEDLASEMGNEEEIEGASIEVNDISNGGNLACEMIVSSTESMIDGDTFVDNGDTYTFNMEAGELGDAEEIESMGIPFEFNINVTMPGEIVEATNGGQIDGNTATYTGTDWMSSGFQVTGNKSASGGTGGQENGEDDNNNGDGGSEDGPTGIEGPDVTGGDDGEQGSDEGSRDSDSDSDGFPTWAWFAIGGGVLLLLIIAGVAVAMSSKKKNQNNNQQFGGYQGQFGGQPQNGPYGGQPQQGQYGGQPGYGNQPYQQNPNQGGQYGQQQGGQQQPPSYNPNNPQGPYQG